MLKDGKFVAPRNRAFAAHIQNRVDPEALSNETTPYLYTRLHTLALHAQVRPCRELAEYLIKERKEKPDVYLYTSLILSNISHREGAAWRVAEYLEEMREIGLQPDVGCCHAVLKVLAVHPDHLLRADVLEYMRTRWMSVSEEGQHDVVAGLFREGSFEQALTNLDEMKNRGARVQTWLLDMAVYVMCAAGEVDEAYHIMRQRYEAGEFELSRTAWYVLLDQGSSYRHHPSTALAWKSQVNTGYLNPSSGICLNVLTTASQAGDAALAVDVFTRLSKRGTNFQPIHYQLLMECYLNQPKADLKRALTTLSIMALQKIEPTMDETRALFLYLRSNPHLVPEAFSILHELHEHGRKVPIAALNLLIECYVDQRNLSEALKIYKLIHTFIPATEAWKKTFANIDTFNLLFKGCRSASPPDEAQASFLVSELLALRLKPTPLTYDRLILVFLAASKHAIETSLACPNSESSEAQRKKGVELMDWACRHFTDMRGISASASHKSEYARTSVTSGWMPRFGTVEILATQLASLGDGRCWDVLQACEDCGEEGLEGWDAKGGHLRANVEKAWAKARAGAPAEKVDREDSMSNERPNTAAGNS
ncbi:hypothetical protein M433DRAFT_65294 [Acidomyces richmondensis BFW]|nr:MAG: hypothetical protein FE78DRAFT_145529 [Acidomyces sp. 'richmondensis']KYG46379.1 hypothetical protein M433DRAFT_65294 [Acidomyces richmondensis BFW]